MTIPAYVTSHLADPVRATFWLVEIAFAVPQRLTDCDQPIVFGGNSYTPAPLTIEGVRNDPSDTASVSGAIVLGAANDYWPTLLSALAADERHPAVTITQAWLDPTTLSPTPSATWGRLAGRIESAEWSPTEARLTVGLVADPAISRLPFREYGEKCSYRKFKGAQCGYAGPETTCDRTFQRCTALANQARFGGFRYPPEAAVEIVWNWQNSAGDLFFETLTLTRREG